MHSNLFFFWIPLILIFLTPVVQVVLSSLSLKRKIKMPLWGINLVSVLLGFVLPIAATIISMLGLPLGTRCATGCIGVAILGFLIAIIAIPLIGVINYIIYLKKQKMI
jgi:hypothetical protein